MRIPSLREVRDYDAARASFPGEHVAVTSAGAAALLMAARGAGASPLKRLALGGLGLALLARGVSGRDGLAALVARKRPAGREARVSTPFGTPSAPDPSASPATTGDKP